MYSKYKFDKRGQKMKRQGILSQRMRTIIDGPDSEHETVVGPASETEKRLSRATGAESGHVGENASETTRYRPDSTKTKDSSSEQMLSKHKRLVFNQLLNKTNNNSLAFESEFPYTVPNFDDNIVRSMNIPIQQYAEALTQENVDLPNVFSRYNEALNAKEYFSYLAILDQRNQRTVYLKLKKSVFKSVQTLSFDKETAAMTIQMNDGKAIAIIPSEWVKTDVDRQEWLDSNIDVYSFNVNQDTGELLSQVFRTIFPEAKNMENNQNQIRYYN